VQYPESAAVPATSLVWCSEQK